jgi:hypothetical protein
MSLVAYRLSQSADREMKVRMLGGEINEYIMFLVEESNKGVHYEDQERDSSRTLIRTYF